MTLILQYPDYFFLNLSNDDNFSPSKGNSLQWLIIFNKVDFLYVSIDHMFSLVLRTLLLI